MPFPPRERLHRLTFVHQLPWFETGHTMSKFGLARLRHETRVSAQNAEGVDVLRVFSRSPTCAQLRTLRILRG